jgi:phenylalanyl-tRNA synthetase beta chain
VDVYPRPVAPRTITLRPGRVNAILGTGLRRPEISDALHRLGLSSTAAAGGARSYSIPTWRVDLEREIDLIEEVARVIGYDAIPLRTAGRVEFTARFPVEPVTARLRRLGAGLGYREAVTLSLQAEGKARLGSAAPVLLRNAQNQEMAAMRSSLIPGLLDVVALNLNRGNPDLRLFEIGHVFERGEVPGAPVPGYRERLMMAFVATGVARPPHWSEPSASFTVFDLKGDISNLLEACQLDKRLLIPYSTPDALADPALAIETDGRRVGYLGPVRGGLLKSLGIGQEVFIAEVECEALLARPERRRTRPIPRFPRVRRDLAFVLDARVPSGDVEAVIRAHAGPLLQRVELFDVFTGTSLPPGARSLAFALEFMSYERTLTEGDVDAELRRVVDAVGKSCGGVLRSV